jgi:hypothetical protein
VIVFDLRCGGDHVFEAWFATSADFEEQKGRGLVRCPICQDAGIEKAPMMPNVGRKSNARADLVPASRGAGEPDQVAEIKDQLRLLAELQARIEAASDYVGERFPDEVRAMYYGDKEERLVHGEATRDQAIELVEEGIPIAPLPFPSRKRADA